MNPMQEAVRKWHERFGVTVGDSPAIRTPDLRVALIEEEARETCEAICRGDLVEAIDGMCDVLYVVFGTAIAFRVDLAPFFAEVHRTNMTKVGGATREDGKILKPEGWEPPRIAAMLAELSSESAVSVICINDGTSSPSIEEARADGWAVYGPTPQQEAQGYCSGMCPGRNEDAFASGAYV